MHRHLDRQRLHDDLRGLVAGDVLCDVLSTQLYSTDASLYQVRPLAVVRPRTANDIVATVQYAAQQELPIHPRGSGSGVAGESIGHGIVLDCSTHLRRIKPSDDGSRVHVQSGAPLWSVNRTLRPHGRWYGPDPATRSVTTMGGVIGTNASGSHYLRSGSARDTMIRARIVTASGELVELSQHDLGEARRQLQFEASTEDSTTGTTDRLQPRGDPHQIASSHFAARVAVGLTEIQQQFVPQPSESTLADGGPQAKFPRSPASGGYRIDDLRDGSGRVDLAKFFAGTQGTLGVLVDATLRTELIPAHRGVVLLFFHRLDSAARAAVRSLQYGPIAADVMDRRLLEIARESDRRFAETLPREAEAGMLVEIQGESLGDLYDRLAVMRQTLSSGPDAAFDSLDTVRDEERDLYWALFRRVIPRQYQVRGNQLPLPFVEDIYSPPDQLPGMLTAVQNVLKEHQATATIFAHVGHGQLHVRPMLDMARAEDRSRLQPLSQAIAEVVWRRGGQIGVEHAAGLSRSYLMPAQFGELWQAMGQVKRLFDPAHRFNPGKLFGAVLQKPGENLRPTNQTIEIVASGRSVLPMSRAAAQSVALGIAKQSESAEKHRDDGGVEAEKQREPGEHDDATRNGHAIASPDPSDATPTSSKTARLVESLLPHSPPPQLEVLQQWSGGNPVARATRDCNGCARCRAHASDERQCPMFRITAAEEASPRAKANLLRGVISGQLPVDSLTGERAKAVADLCFNCHSCRVECPASVNIPKIVGEIKAQYVATNGLPVSDWLMGRVDSISSAGARLSFLMNPLVRNGLARWMIDRFFGVSAARELPAFSNESFVRYAIRRRWHKASPSGGLKVVYMVDQFANYHDPEIGRAFVEILQQNRIGVYVPPSQTISGMARITAGDLKGARRIARRNVRVLAEAVRQGYTVVATEPSAALCLTHEYPNLLDTEDAHLVAEHSFEACQYLWSLHEGERLDLDFVTTSDPPTMREMLYHHPCHSRVLQQEPVAARLMELLPGVVVKSADAGCSGMAGTWGLQRKNYRNSLRIGWPLISKVRNRGDAVGTSECSACRLQMQHGTGAHAVHPLKMLASAYGRLGEPIP
ncbi:MAG: FAD-linked oxidase C-terminal domain-containing protein [Planctomycetota bacterium]